MLSAATLTLAITDSARAQLPPLPNDHVLGYKVGIDQKAMPPGSPLPKGTVGTIVDHSARTAFARSRKRRRSTIPPTRTARGSRIPRATT
jgi:hypothetical protein